MVCRSFIDAYYSLPPTLGVAIAADKALSGINRWLNGMASADSAMEGAATTFTAAVLRDRFVHVLHVGDSRAWLLRDGVLSQLSTDHALPGPEDSHILLRAVGLESTVRLDYSVLVCWEPHDRLLLTSDGVHGVMTDQALEDLAGRLGPPDRDADAVVAMPGHEVHG